MCPFLFLPISSHAPPLRPGGHVRTGQGGGLPGTPHRSHASRYPVCPRGFNLSLRPSLAGSASLQCPLQAETGNAGKGWREPAPPPPGPPPGSACLRAPVSHPCVCVCVCVLCPSVCARVRKISKPPVPRLKSEHLPNKTGIFLPPLSPASLPLCSSCRQPPAPDFEILETKLVL